MKRTLAVDLRGLPLPTPVMVASGCAGTGREVSGLVDLRKVGGIVTRSITLRPRKGDPTPRITESPSGIVWSTGFQNPGIEAFIADELPRLARMGPPVVVSITGGSLEEFARLTTLLQRRDGIAAIETQVSGRDDELDREVLVSRADRAAEVVGAVARMSMIPVFAKLPPLVSDLVEIARACVRAGAHGLTLVDSAPALAVDAGTLRARLGAIDGRLSGPALRPIALRAIHQVAVEMPEVPLIGCGGVRTGEDAIEMLLAGAWAVQVGTAAIVDPSAPVEVAAGVGRYLKEKGLGSPADLTGRLRGPGDRA